MYVIKRYTHTAISAEKIKCVSFWNVATQKYIAFRFYCAKVVNCRDPQSKRGKLSCYTVYTAKQYC